MWLKIALYELECAILFENVSRMTAEGHREGYMTWLKYYMTEDFMGGPHPDSTTQV